MIPQRLIEEKRDGRALSDEQMTDLLTGYHQGRVPDHQMAAFLMAVLFRGLSQPELKTMLRLMLESGERLDFSDLSPHVVDKHSTGGVGDKTSLVLAPLVASLGARVPMMSGRGLGHTGGTLDKLHAIEGFRTDLSLAEFRDTVEQVGCAMIGQTEQIAPLDKRLYALRDLTGTVPSPPLITTSILSKKLAEGIVGLVLDVKVGSGAFIPGREDALDLARLMVATAEAEGVRTVARLTAMDRPLGRAIGNALEVAEALDTLLGRGPTELRVLCVDLAVEMLMSCGRYDRDTHARHDAEASLDDGRAFEVFSRMVSAQGGDATSLEQADGYRNAPHVEVARAARSGVVAAIEPRRLGWGVVELGGGRRALSDRIDPAVGFLLDVEPGTVVSAGDPLGRVFARSAGDGSLGLRTLQRAIRIEDEAAEVLPLLLDRVDSESLAAR